MRNTWYVDLSFTKVSISCARGTDSLSFTKVSISRACGTNDLATDLQL